MFLMEVFIFAIIMYLILRVKFRVLESKIDKLSASINNLNNNDINNAEKKALHSITSQKQSTTEKTASKNIYDNVAKEHKVCDINEVSNIIETSNLSKTQNENIKTLSDNEIANFPKVKKEDGVFIRFIKWIRQDWPMKVGGILVILATGWFVTYAAERGWLSEIARVTLGYLFGIATLTYGSIRTKIVKLQGNVFLVIGVAAIFISTLAGVDFPTVPLSEIAALFVMFITVGFVSLLALKQKNINLSGAIIFFGATVPLFFFDALDIDIIFLYLLMLTLGTLWIVAQSRWRSLTLMMLVVVMFYAIGHAITTGEEISIFKNMMVSIVFALAFYGANVVAIIKTKKIKPIDVITAVGNGILYTTLTLMFSPEELRVLFLLFGVILFSLASYLIFRYSTSKAPTVIYGGISFILLVISTAIHFDDITTFTIAFVIETTALILLIIYILGNKMSIIVKIFSILLYAIPMFFVLFNINEVFDFIFYSNQQNIYYENYTMFISRDDAIMKLISISVACFSVFLISSFIAKTINIKEKWNLNYMITFTFLGGAIATILVWLYTHIFIVNFDIASFVSLFIFTTSGVGLYVLGFKSHHKAYRILGIILFSIVLLRIFLVEFWDMEMPVKILTAFILGALFISTAFFARLQSDNK